MVEVLKVGKEPPQPVYYGECPFCECVFRCSSEDIGNCLYNIYTVECPTPKCRTPVRVECGGEDHPLNKKAPQ